MALEAVGQRLVSQPAFPSRRAREVGPGHPSGQPASCPAHWGLFCRERQPGSVTCSALHSLDSSEEAAGRQKKARPKTDSQRRLILPRCLVPAQPRSLLEKPVPEVSGFYSARTSLPLPSAGILSELLWHPEWGIAASTKGDYLSRHKGPLLCLAEAPAGFWVASSQERWPQGGGWQRQLTPSLPAALWALLFPPFQARPRRPKRRKHPECLPAQAEQK